MELDKLEQRHLDAIKKFVNTDEFLEIKDAFVSHTPEGGTDGNRQEDASKNLGKFLGTRYVFNKLESLARKPKQPEPQGSQTKKQQPVGRTTTGKDPDLDA